MQGARITFLRGFTVSEGLIVLAIVAVLAGALIPLYRTYKIRTDLGLAVEQTQQMLHMAQLRSQTGDRASNWGVRADEGVLFLGSGFTLRDSAFDEVFTVPESVSVSGLTEVYYSQLYGVPSAVGDIVFTALNGERRTITIASNTLSGPPVPPVQFSVHFDRIKNSGNGSAENAVYVGESAVRYEEDTWIPLTSNEIHIIDSGIELAVTGLSAQRESGFFRVVAYGGLESGGKEVVDAVIRIDNGYIDRIENEDGDNEGEQPFDGNENEGVGGDEYTLSADKRSVEFKTRVTNAGDTILIFWKGGNP